jgi:phage gpG-like protein
MIEIKIDDAGVQEVFNRLIARGENLQGPLAAIGEKVAEFTKSRFEQSADPYGTPWAPNSDTTLRELLHGSGKNFTKKGALSARGKKVLSGKKPLIGESKDLSTKIAYEVQGDSVVIFSPMIYAAMQQFGGTRSPRPSVLPERSAGPAG